MNACGAPAYSIAYRSRGSASVASPVRMPPKRQLPKRQRRSDSSNKSGARGRCDRGANVDGQNVGGAAVKGGRGETQALDGRAGAADGAGEGGTPVSWGSCACYASAAIVGAGVVAGAALGTDWLRLRGHEAVRALRESAQLPGTGTEWLKLQRNETVQALTRVGQQSGGATTATVAGGLLAAAVLCQRPRKDESSVQSHSTDRSHVQKRWKRAGRVAKSLHSFQGKVFDHDDFTGVYSIPDQIDLKECEGLINSKLIGASAGETSTAKRWSKLRSNRIQVADIMRGRAVGLQATKGPPQTPKTMSVGEAAMTANRIRKHSALVFDCADDHTVVYKLQHEPESCSVRANVVGSCAGVAEILRRNAGSWFLKFVMLTCETQKRISEPEVSMVGTAAWYESGADDMEKKRLKSIWNSIDSDQSGTLDENELRRALDNMGKVMSDEEFTNVWGTVDSDQSGQVSFNEFMAWYKQQDNDEGAAGNANANANANAGRARELVSSLTHKGLLCKRLGGSEQAIFESLAVREVACRLGMSPHPQYFIGTGGTWVHCVALNSTVNPIVLCNDGALGWVEGVRRLGSSLDPLSELDTWLHDTVKAELDSVESQRVESIG
eukprot:COSAG02_NODE_3446_length_6727_cov_3.084339_5_plen_609_part_01